MLQNWTIAAYWTGRQNLVTYWSRKMRISYARERGDSGSTTNSLASSTRTKLRISIGQMVDDLELIAGATSRQE